MAKLNGFKTLNEVELTSICGANNMWWVVGAYGNNAPTLPPIPVFSQGPYPVQGNCPSNYHDLGYIGGGVHLCGF